MLIAAAGDEFDGKLFVCYSQQCLRTTRNLKREPQIMSFMDKFREDTRMVGPCFAPYQQLSCVANVFVCCLIVGPLSLVSSEASIHYCRLHNSNNEDDLASFFFFEWLNWTLW